MTPGRLRVATFNIRHGLGRDAAIDLERTAAVIRATGAGVVALQEVDRRLPRSGRVDQSDVLGERTGLEAHFIPTLRRAGGEYGLALLSDVPLRVTSEALPRVAGEEPRRTVATCWRGIHLIATHLARGGEPRAAQTRALAARAARLPSPAVVLGDLNQGPRSLTDLVAAGFPPGPRRPTFSLGRQIDHVLAGPGVRLVRLWTVETDASDHLPLVADLEVPGPAEP